MENEITSMNEQAQIPQEVEEVRHDVQEAASKLLTPTLTSLNNTQKNALGISGLVGHVEEFSGHEQYVQANDAIMLDPTLTIQEKLKLKRENDEWQDLRTAKGANVVAGLQNVNTRNNTEATNSWVGTMLIGFGVGALSFFGFTKPGRQIAGAALKAIQQIAV